MAIPLSSSCFDFWLLEASSFKRFHVFESWCTQVYSVSSASTASRSAVFRSSNGCLGIARKSFLVYFSRARTKGPSCSSLQPCLAFFSYSSSLAIQSSSHSHFDMPWATATRYRFYGPLAAVVVLVSSSTRLFFFFVFFFMPYMHARTNPWIQSVYFSIM